MRRCLLLALATAALVAGLPTSVGYVNDFAGKLSPDERQALDTRLRDYERATSNEVAIAIVESLEGQSIDTYANRLFKSWGIGKKERNNGVLLLWAPAERKVRIEVGLGLAGAISNVAAAQIVQTVTALFRRGDYLQGLDAGVDAILARLNADAPRYSVPTPAPVSEPPAESRNNDFLILIPLLAIAGLIGWITVRYRRGRKRQLSAEVPRDLGRAAAALGEGESLRKSAAIALEHLRQEAPQEVWEEFQPLVANAGSELSGLQGELAGIGAMPMQELSELGRAHRALKRWNGALSELRDRLLAVGARLDSYRYSREHGQLLLNELRESLDRRGPGSGWGQAAKLTRAAGETYALAVTAAAASPANWLLVYDLLMDAQECLQGADDPGSFRPSQRSRIWMADDLNSPALILMMQPEFNPTPVSSSSVDSGSFSSGDSSGGDGGDFGGGDSGGGGSSGDY